MTTTGSKPVVDFCADYETYYDAEYSLSKITTLEYVRSPRFELHMMSWKCPALGVHKPRRAIGDRMIQEVFDMLKGASQYVDFRLVGANSGTFDAFIADYHNGFRFMHHFDVSLMARWVLGNTLKDCKLETIATRLDVESSQELRKEAFDALGMADDGLGKKISIALSAVKGLHIHEINPQLMAAYAAYCDLDVELTWGVYQELVKNSDPFAIYIQELYINAFLDFPVEIDTDLLSTLKDDYIEQRAEEVAAFGDCLDSGTAWEGLKSIRSKDKFAALLVSLGVPQESLPLKQGKNGLIYAFSKSDMALDTLAAQYEAEDSLVPEACRLRLEYNSSMAEGKMNKFLAAGLTGPWAFHIKPASAPNTGRHSGGSSAGSCFTGEMELLTPDGWVRADELPEGVPVMQYDRHTQVMKFVLPDEYHHYVSDDVYAIQSSHITGHFTGNHRWWGKRGTNYAKKWQEMHVCDTTTLAGIPMLTGMPLAGVYAGAESDLTDDMLRFHAMVQADGNVFARSSRQRSKGEYAGDLSAAAIRFGFNKQRKVDRCLSLLSALGIECSEDDNRDSGGRYVVYVGKVPAWFVGKWYGSWVLGLSGRQMGVIVSEAVEWDGCNHAVQSWRKRGSQEYTTGRYDQAEWVQTMAHLSGTAVSMLDNTASELQNKGCVLSDGKYAVYYKTENTTSVSTYTHPKGRKRFVRKMDGRYKVYCVSVPSECILVRHNDNVFVTMNSPHNLKRAKPTLDTSCKMGIRFREDVGLRDVIMAKPGQELCVSDLSGIEMRTTLTFCKDYKYMEILRDPDRDVYCETATDIFERPITKKDKNERFVGKLAELSLSYLTGWKKLHHTARLWGNPITVELAQLVHAMYRRSHPPVVDMWDMLEEIMFMLADGGKFSQVLDPFYVDEQGIHVPNGFLIQYPGIRYDRKSRRFTYYNAARRCVVNVHKGLLLENCSQSVSTAVFNDIHARAHAKIIDQFPAAKLVGSVHDEILYTSPLGEGASVLAIILQEMERPPVWWPELSVRGEGDFGRSLLEHGDGSYSARSRYGCLK